jgi:hypothetical protein
MAGMGCNACNRGESGGDERWKIGNISGKEVFVVLFQSSLTPRA